MTEKLIREVKAVAENGVEYVDKEEYVDAVVIPEKATNGDVIKALFPKGYQTARESIMRFSVDDYTYEFSYPWWYAPYRKE